MKKEHITNLLTTIETLAGYACQDSLLLKTEEEDFAGAESFLFVIELMAREAKGWLQFIPADDK